MIRLNDIRKTVIDENALKGYSKLTADFYDAERKVINRGIIDLIFENGGLNVEYETKKERDKDIELLDKLFDVKSIEDKIKYNPSKFNPKKYDPKIQTSIYDFDINGEKESDGK